MTPSHPTHDAHAPLDIHGRKSAMLLELRAELRARRIRRRAFNAIAGAALLAIALTLAWPTRSRPAPPQLVHMPTLPQPTLPAPNLPLPAPPASQPKLAITILETDPHILDRLTCPHSSIQIQRINDDELLLELQRAGHPAGLIRANGQVTVVERLAATSPSGG